MDPVQQLSQMKITYENGKTKHSQWLKENQDMVGIAEYADYVDKFKQWEQQILSSIAQTEAQIKASEFWGLIGKCKHSDMAIFKLYSLF